MKANDGKSPGCRSQQANSPATAKSSTMATQSLPQSDSVTPLAEPSAITPPGTTMSVRRQASGPSSSAGTRSRALTSRTRGSGLFALLTMALGARPSSVVSCP
ncbi:hypothetical protein CLIM01_01663 [Colletotrichum limetticola]|uniref:Uncharacterized protein n=1 Tax=Colletotrichum limetticola TaxID=1209924 RepID=A0ABQ9QBC9_9PEZI|nr:hypothetical protein CLIM01_01663 [Colletotrichum limetticola]